MMAEPPPPARRRLEKSISCMRGCAARPAYRVLTPMNTLGRATFITPIRASRSRGLGTSQLCAPTEK
ncbi:hypothetical protein D3C71_2105760 [compost metagenome]